MNRFASFLTYCILGSTIFSIPALADSATDALSNCLADNTTGKDRKDWAQWVFVAMSAHPEIKPFSVVTEANRDELDQRLAALATKLMTESCKTCSLEEAMQLEPLFRFSANWQ